MHLYIYIFHFIIVFSPDAVPEDHQFQGDPPPPPDSQYDQEYEEEVSVPVYLSSKYWEVIYC